MKRIKYIAITCFVVMAFLNSIFIGKTYAQNDSTKSDPIINLSYIKLSKGEFKLSCGLKVKEDTKFVPVKDESITFYTGTDFAKEVGTLTTDDKGIATLIIANNYHIEKDADGIMSFGVKYKGNKAYNPTETSVLVKDLLLDVRNSTVDSVFTVNIEAFELSDKGKIPVKDLTVGVFVQRMFSLLKVGEGTITEDAQQISVEFPNNLPGDSIGNIMLVVKVEENETYGTVEKVEKINWGIPTMHRIPVVNRTLWTQIAPTWMIVTLVVMLLGVWGHYFYAIWALFRINKHGKKNKKLKSDSIGMEIDG